MKRYSVYTLLFLFSLTVLSGISINAAADEVAEIRAQIADLEATRARVVAVKAAAEAALTQVEQDLVNIRHSIDATLFLISQIEVELAMAVDAAERALWLSRLSEAMSLLDFHYESYAYKTYKKYDLISRIARLDSKIADIDNELMRLYARLAALI